MIRSELAQSCTKAALAELETGRVRLSDVIRKCIRIARLRNDYVNLWWLQMELVNIKDKAAILTIQPEVAPHIEEFERLRKTFGDAWVDERQAVKITEDMRFVYSDSILAKSVGEIEIDFEHYSKLASESHTPQGLHPLDLYFVEKKRSELRIVARTLEHSCGAILERCRVRVHDFLSRAETELVFGQFHSDLFERNRQYVDLRLGKIAPEALEQFVVAYRRAQENDPEARSQALTSCRRLLKSLADALYPATDHEVIGADGKPRVLSDEKYIARLWQYIHERLGRSASGELLVSQVHDLGNRIDRLYDLASKGVHSKVTEFEVNQCVIQTYILVGDLLRLSEGTSSVPLAEGESSP